MIKKISVTLLTQLLTLFIGVITSIIISRALLPEGRGLLAIYIAGTSLVSAFSTIGIGKGLSYEISKSNGDGYYVRIGLGVSLLASSIASIATIVLFLLPGGAIAELIPARLILFAVPTAATLTLMNLCHEILRSIDKSLQYNIAALLYFLIYLSLNVIFSLTAGLTLELVCLAILISQTTVCVYQLYVLQQTSKGVAFDRKIAQKFTRFGLRFLPYTLFSMLHNRVDILLLGIFLTNQAVGFYSTGVNLAQLMWNLPLAVNLLLFPYVAREQTKRNTVVQVARVNRVSTLILIVLSVPLFIFAPWLIELLYGVDFLPSSAPLRILLPGIIAFSVVRISSSELIGRNQLQSLTIVAGVTLVLNILLNLLLVPLFDTRGAAFASTISYTVNAFGVVWLICRKESLSLKVFFMPNRQDFLEISKASKQIMLVPSIVKKRFKRIT